MSDLPFGIDISKHQGVNDYAKMRANTAFVFVKATESWGYTDPMFFKNWQGLVGHNRGAYSYVWLSDDPLRQANHLIDTVTQAGADWRYDRLVLDLEKSGHGLSKAEVTNRVLIMMERIKEVTAGRYPILYSRKYWVQDNMYVDDPRLINADWWLAYYRTALPYPLYTPEMPPPPLLPTGVSKWLFHQTCEKGKGREVGVGSYYVDQNRFNGTRAELDAYFGRDEETPPEPPIPPETKLFDAKVVTTPPNRLRTRYTPAGLVRPEADWLQSQAIVPVYETHSTGWWRVAPEAWSSTQWLARVGEEPPAPPQPPMVGNYAYYGAVYSQRDARWASHPLGTKSTIGANGCLMTCVSMVCNYFRHASNPIQLNNWLTANGGYLDGNLFLWAKVEELYPDMKFDGFVYNPTTAQIRAAIERSDMAGTLPIMHVDFNDSTPLIEMHWVLGIGVMDGDVIIADPWTGTIGKLSEMYPKAVIRYGSYRRQI